MDRQGYQRRSTAGRFGQISITLYWLSVALVTKIEDELRPSLGGDRPSSLAVNYPTVTYR